MYKTVYDSTVHNSKTSETTKMAIKGEWTNCGTVTWLNIPEQWTQWTTAGHSMQASKSVFHHFVGVGSMGLRVQMKEPDQLWH